MLARALRALASFTDNRGNIALDYDYSPGGLLNKFRDSHGNETNLVYDATGRLASIWAPNYGTDSYRYDAGGRLQEKWLPNGVTSRYTWNTDSTLGGLINRRTSAAVISQHNYLYDAYGNRRQHAETIDGTALTYNYTYDSLNRLLTTANGTVAQDQGYRYDPLNNFKSKTVGTPVTATTSYTYDTANQLLDTRDASNNLLSAFVLDANGAMTKKCEAGTVTRTATDCTGTTVTTLGYDSLNRLSQGIKGAATESYAYDHEGRRIRKIVGAATTNYLYSGPDIYAEYGTTYTAPNALYVHGPSWDDPIMRLTGAGTAAVPTYYHQDGLGSVVATSTSTGTVAATQRFDAWGNVLSASGTIAQYGYTGREPDATGLVYYRARYYDPTIARFSQRDPIGLAGGINRYAYVGGNPVNFTDPMGLKAQEPTGSVANECSQYKYNADNTLTQLKNRVGYSDSNIITQHDYTYDGVANRQTHTEKISATTTPYKYVYDELNRLKETRNNTTNALIESANFDPINNRMTRSDGVTTTYAIVDAANQITEQHSGSTGGPLTQAFIYDTNGNLTKKCEGTGITKTASDCSGSIITTLTYDALDQLTQVAKTGLPTESYKYDDQGRRIQKTVGTTVTNYLYNGPDVYAEYPSTWTTASATYVHGPNMDDPIARTAGTTTQYYHQDGLGSVVALSGSTGTTDATRRFDSWGNTIASTGTLPQFGFTGREPDATGLIYYRARYYDPSVGRFAQRDPIGLSGGVNQYAYVGNNPTNYTDPEGLCPSCVGAAGSVVLGGAIRWFSGEEVFNAQAIATDAALGAVGAGFANKLAQGAELAARASMATRAQAIHTAVGARTQNLTTIAITRGADQSGRAVNIVTSSESKLRPAQLAMLRTNEIAGSVSRAGAGHAEVNGLRVAESLGVNPAVTAASRPVCAGCEQALGEAGVGIASALKSGNPMSIGLNLPSLSIGQSALVGFGAGQGTQALYDFAFGSSIAPYSGGAAIGVNPRASK